MSNSNEAINDGAIDEDQGRRARSYALRLLAIRARTVSEVRRRLVDRDFDGACVDETIEWLISLGYLDDRAYAKDWIESRARSKPAGRRLIAWELEQKGVDRDVAREVAETIGPDDELRLARAAAKARLLRMTGGDERVVRRRLEAHLHRRGFARETIAKVVSESLSGLPEP